jgi:hypothetical protein
MDAWPPGLSEFKMPELPSGRGAAMKTSVRGICRLSVVTVLTVLSVGSLYAADENWPTREALGDVLVTQTGFVVVYGNDGTLKHTITLGGDNREIAFDTFLNAYVANVNGTTGRIVKLPAASPHTPDAAAVTFTSALVNSDYNISTPQPRSVAFDRVQNLWVGLDNRKSMPGGKFVGVIQRYAQNAAVGPYVLKEEFSVQSDGGPISLDVYVTGAGGVGTSVVYYTSRGKTVRQLGVNLPKWTLTGTGAAAQLRILHPPKGEGTETGGVVVGYTTEFKFVTAGGTERSCNFSDSVPTGQRQRTHVELDANPLFWWAGDAGSGEWRKLNFKDGCSAAPNTPTIATNLPSGGGASNGGLRVGPHLSFLTFPVNSTSNPRTTKTAGFLPTADPAVKTGFTHSVTAAIANTTGSEIKAAAWFVEVSSDGLCDSAVVTQDPYELSDFDCRSVEHFTESGTAFDVHPAVDRTSRGREHYAWIQEITPTLVEQPLATASVKINVSVGYNDVLPVLQGCPSGVLRATWMLDDVNPDLHQAAGGTDPVVFNQFDLNSLGAFFGDPTTSTGTKTTFNHYAVVRAPVDYAALLDPVINTQTSGSTLTLTFTIRDAACHFITGQADFMNVTVDLNRQPRADRFGYSGQFLSGTGILPVTEQTSVERYKINVFLDPKIFPLDKSKAVTTFLACVNYDRAQFDPPPDIGVREHCVPFGLKAGGKK